MQTAILLFWSHTPRRSRRTRNVSLNSRTAQSCAIMHSQRRRALWSLEHFSVVWPKERARRQYAQYGEREATQGKSLKNALSIKRALHFPFIQFDFREIQGVTRWQQKKWYSAIKPAPKSSKASIFWPMQLK